MSSFRRHLSTLLLGTFLVTGACLAFVIPPFQVPDENLHWTSATARYDRLFGGEDRSCSPGIALPDHFEWARLHFRPEQKIARGAYDRLGEMPRVCSGDPIPYGGILTYPGVGAARVLLPGLSEKGDTALLQFHLARMLHGLLIFAFLYRLARLGGPLVLLALATSPLFIQQSFGISSDVTTNALALSLATFLLCWKKLRHDSWGDWGALLAVGASVAVTKPTVLPAILAVALALLILHGPRDWRGEALKQWLATPEGKKLALFLTISGVLSAYCLIVALLFEFPPFQQGDPVAQRLHVLAHPGQALLVIGSSVLGMFHIPAFHGPLGWLDTWLPTQTRNLWLFICILALGHDLARAARAGVSARLPAWLAMGSITLGLFGSGCLIGYALYLSFTPVGAPRVDGLQGRYFFVHLILFIAAGLTCFRTKDEVVPQEDGAVAASTGFYAMLELFTKVVLFALSLFVFVRIVQAVATRYW